MSFVSTGGITKLSQLTIDADKDWQTKGISNIKELALAMIMGDLLVHDGTKIIRFPAGVANLMLTSNGLGLMPSWQPGGTYLNRFFPVVIDLSHIAAKNTARTYSEAKGLPATSVHVDETGNDPANMLIMRDPAITVPKVATLNAARTYVKAVAASALHTHYDLQILVTGAVADDGGVQTNETAAAQSAAANDMTLLPAAPANDDAYYFGHDIQFDVLRLNIGTPGVGVWSLIWEYYTTGAAWAALAGVTDGTTDFKAAAGWREVTYTRPADWDHVAVSGLDRFWIRARLAFTNLVTQPLGTQAQVRIIT